MPESSLPPSPDPARTPARRRFVWLTWAALFSHPGVRGTGAVHLAGDAGRRSRHLGIFPSRAVQAQRHRLRPHQRTQLRVSRVSLRAAGGDGSLPRDHGGQHLPRPGQRGLDVGVLAAMARVVHGQPTARVGGRGAGAGNWWRSLCNRPASISHEHTSPARGDLPVFRAARPEPAAGVFAGVVRRAATPAGGGAWRAGDYSWRCCLSTQTQLRVGIAAAAAPVLAAALVPWRQPARPRWMLAAARAGGGRWRARGAFPSCPKHRLAQGRPDEHPFPARDAAHHPRRHHRRPDGRGRARPRRHALRRRLPRAGARRTRARTAARSRDRAVKPYPSPGLQSRLSDVQ